MDVMLIHDTDIPLDISNAERVICSFSHEAGRAGSLLAF